MEKAHNGRSGNHLFRSLFLRGGEEVLPSGIETITYMRLGLHLGFFCSGLIIVGLRGAHVSCKPYQRDAASLPGTCEPRRAFRRALAPNAASSCIVAYSP